MLRSLCFLSMILLCACSVQYRPVTASIDSVRYMIDVFKLQAEYGPRHHVVIEEASRRHIEFIVRYSDLKYDPSWGLPTVVFWPRELINSSHPDRPNEIYKWTWKPKTIILPDDYGHWADWDGIFVHALVHWLQDRNGVLNPWPCPNRDELLAYNLQAGWVAAMRGEVVLAEHAAEVRRRVEAVAQCRT